MSVVAMVVVWASGSPAEVECAAPVRKLETFTLGSPIADKPVVDHLGSLLLPEVGAG